MNITSYYNLYNTNQFIHSLSSVGNTSKVHSQNTRLASSYYNGLYQRQSSSNLSASKSNLLLHFDDYYSNLKDSAATLQSAARKSTSTTRYTSSDRSVASVDSSTYSYKKEAVSLEVETVAKGQTNTSESVSTDAHAALHLGENDFSISKDGVTRSFSVKVDSKNTNQEVLDKVAKEINASGLGLTANVTTKDGKSSLSITSEEGVKNNFSIKDTSGNLVSTLKLNQVAQSASDAKYRVNGKNYTSSSNQITIDEAQAKVTLKSTGKTTLSTGKNVDTAYQAAQQFVSDYNKALSLVSNTSGQTTKLKALSQSLSGIGSTNKYSLKDIGIDVSASGKMSIDEERFTKAFNKDAQHTSHVLSKIGEQAERSSEYALHTPTTSLLSSSDSSTLTSAISDQEEYYNALFAISKNSFKLSNYYAAAGSLGLFLNSLV